MNTSLHPFYQFWNGHEHSVAADPSQWTVVHDAARTLNEEELSLPTDVYTLGMDILQNSLQPNANQLLDHLRQLLEVRTNRDVAGETAVSHLHGFGGGNGRTPHNPQMKSWNGKRPSSPHSRHSVR